MNPELVQYIKAQLRQGIPEVDITQMLQMRGWPLETIDHAFKYVQAHPNEQLQDTSNYSGKLRGPIELLEDSLVFLRQRILSVFVIVAIPTIANVSIIAVGGLTFFFFFLNSLGDFGKSREETVLALSNQLPTYFTGFIIFVVGATLVFTLINTWGQAALYAFIHKRNEYINSQTSVLSALKFCLSQTFALLWIFILGLFFLSGGFAFFVVPGIIFAVWFTFVPMIVIAEHTRGIQAFLRSREYVRGKWGYVLWRIVCIAGFYLLGTILFMILGRFSRLSTLASILSFIYSLLATPVMLVYLFFLYEDLRYARGSFDVQSSNRLKILLYASAAIGILFFVGLMVGGYATYKNISGRTMDLKRLNDLQHVQTALEQYYVVNLQYPATLDELASEYISSIPKDPKTNQPYKYTQQEEGQAYEFCAKYATLLPEKGGECLKSRKTAPSQIDPPSPIPTIEALPSPTPIPLSPDNQRLVDITTIQTALQQYFADNNDHKYPENLDTLGIYILAAPEDPVTNLPYPYIRDEDGLDYEMCVAFDTIREQGNSTICFAADKKPDNIITETPTP